MYCNPICYLSHSPFNGNVEKIFNMTSLTLIDRKIFLIFKYFREIETVFTV